MTGSTPSGRHRISVTVNGIPRIGDVDPTATLLSALREDFGLTGSKSCCTVGECGACSVLLDGRLVNSCLVLAVEADGLEVVTVEGLAASGLTGVQRAFLEQGAVQCGFCIPGMVMAAEYLLRVNPAPSVDEIRDGLSGNLCRCAGYERIVAAVAASSESEARP